MHIAMKNNGTPGRTRTGTPEARDFKSLVSTIPPPGQKFMFYNVKEHC